MQISARTTGGIVRIAVTTGGTGYTSPPTLTLAGGGGAGATAYAHIDSGVVESVVVQAAGTGYTAAPTISFSGGGGTGAAATAAVYSASLRPMAFFKGRSSDVYGVDGMGRGLRWDGSSTAVEPIGLVKPAIGPAVTFAATTAGNFVSGIQLVIGGAGYHGTPSVTITGGTPSRQATARAVVSNGRVSRVDVTDAGAGYQATPQVAFSGGIGTGATLTVGVVGEIARIDVLTSGTGYQSDAVTAPTVVLHNTNGLTDFNSRVTVNSRGGIDSVVIAAAGTGATTGGVTASITGGGGNGAVLQAYLTYGVRAVTVSNSGSGYHTPPVVSFRAAAADSIGAGAEATASVNAAGNISAVTVISQGAYALPPTAFIEDTSARAQVSLGSPMRGKYLCAIRYLDDTAPAVPSSISELVEVDVGDGASSIAWSFTHHGIDARVSAMELWRTTADQGVLLFRVATIQRSGGGWTTAYTDSLNDETLKDPERDGYGLMPITLPSGQINARRFEVPPGNYAVACMFQDRAWYAVDTTGERPNSLLFSEVDEPEAVPLANELVVQENTGVPDSVVALIPIGPHLLVAQRNHIYRLAYVAQPVLDASISLAAYRGVLNNRCWDCMGGVAFLVDGYGLYGCDGSTEDALSVAVDNYWRDGIIDFSKADQFHVRADTASKTVRFYYCQSGDTQPVRALCYCVATRAWWEETYATAVTATCPTILSGRNSILSGQSNGVFTKPDSSPGAGIPYELRTGPQMLTNADKGDRHVSVLYRPTNSSRTLRVRAHYNNSSSPRANAVAFTRGDGFTTVNGSTEATLDMASSRSPLGDATGMATLRLSGRVDERSAGGDRHVAVVVAGTQAGTDPVVLYGLTIAGAQ
jgi:hypothetical protein